MLNHSKSLWRSATEFPPKQLVENRMSFAGPHSELCIYDTYEPAVDVLFKSDQLLYCGMISGKKIMHGDSEGNGFSQDFLPHESFVMAPNSEVEIDFPEARLDQPTRCLTIEISNEKVTRLVEPLLEHNQISADQSAWYSHPQQMFHALHGEATQAVVNRLFHAFLENDSERDIAIEFGIAELVSRLAKQKGYEAFMQNVTINPQHSGLHQAVEYLKNHLDQPLDVYLLAQTACMSRSKFFEAFKKVVGCTPAELQHKLRLDRAITELKKGKTITQVGLELGYASPSHFCRRFQQQFGKSPSQYLKQGRQ